IHPNQLLFYYSNVPYACLLAQKVIVISNFLSRDNILAMKAETSWIETQKLWRNKINLFVIFCLYLFSYLALKWNLDLL
ncbi:hypothetical protein ACJX0J_032298, partial [Zea mays]